MKNLKSNKAFQNILKNAPEMPASKMPDENPNSNNGIAALLLSLGLVLISQFVILSKMNTISKQMIGRINYNPIEAEDAEEVMASTEKEILPVDDET